MILPGAGPRGLATNCIFIFFILINYENFLSYFQSLLGANTFHFLNSLLKRDDMLFKYSHSCAPAFDVVSLVLASLFSTLKMNGC